MFVKPETNEREIDVPWMPPCPQCGEKLLIETSKEQITKTKRGGGVVRMRPVIFCPNGCLDD